MSVSNLSGVVSAPIVQNDVAIKDFRVRNLHATANIYENSNNFNKILNKQIDNNNGTNIAANKDNDIAQIEETLHKELFIQALSESWVAILEGVIGSENHEGPNVFSALSPDIVKEAFVIPMVKDIMDDSKIANNMNNVKNDAKA